MEKNFGTDSSSCFSLLYIASFSVKGLTDITSLIYLFYTCILNNHLRPGEIFYYSAEYLCENWKAPVSYDIYYNGTV